MSLSIHQRAPKGSSAAPAKLLERIAESVLGTGYEVSLVYIGDARARALNRAYRKKDSPANVLSFPLARDAGEIFINVKQAKRDALSGGISLKRRITYLFIHGLLHLKGMSHGSTMERNEEELERRFSP